MCGGHYVKARTDKSIFNGVCIHREWYRKIAGKHGENVLRPHEAICDILKNSKGVNVFVRIGSDFSMGVIRMEQKRYLNRYKSFQCSLSSLEEARKRDLTDDFVISGTVQKFCLTFDISWKVMKDIIVGYHKISSFASGSPRETLRMAAQLGIISGDIWMKMLLDRNELTHDYDGSLARNAANKIVELYLPVFEHFRDIAARYMDQMEKDDKL